MAKRRITAEEIGAKWDKLRMTARKKAVSAEIGDKACAKKWANLSHAQQGAVIAYFTGTQKSVESLEKDAPSATKHAANRYGKRRSNGNEDPVALFIAENVASNDQLRLLALNCIKEVASAMTDKQIRADRERIKATSTRSNQGLARMSLGLMIRKYVRLSGKDASRLLKKALNG